MKAGDRIKWIYTHHYNSRSQSLRAKYGEYIGKVRHTIRYNGIQLVVVHFDGNKRTSRIPINELIGDSNHGL